MSVQPGPELSDLSTGVLLDRAKQGDGKARDALCHRYLPRLQRWARGRLPSDARGVLETDELVEKTRIETFKRDEAFDPEQSRAFLGYVRGSVDRRIVDEIRKVGRRPAAEETAYRVADPGPSPLAGPLDSEKSVLYEKAFARLELTDQAAIRGVSKTASGTTKSPASSENRPQMPPGWR